MRNCTHRLLCALALAALASVDGAFAQDAPATSPQIARTAPAETAPAGTLTVGPLDLSVSWRIRFEHWSWFDAQPASGNYQFLNSLVRAGVGQTRESFNWRVEFAQPSFLGVPEHAVAPPPQGAGGLGAAYFGANEGRKNHGTVFLKQGYLDIKTLGASALKLGRFEFFDGTEVAYAHPALRTLVQSRVAHRLISNEAFPAAQRSFDGALFTWNGSGHHVTGFASRPTSGGVHLNGWKELDIEVYYGAYNRTVSPARGAGAFRAFAVGYVDRRDALKPDNRPAGVRTADRASVALGTYGASYVHVFETRTAGSFDMVAWAAAQTGSWGVLSHRASSAFGEVGWQPPHAGLRPWIRAGYRYSSGDDNPADDRNGTFYQVFGATRQYARFPFYNLMNLQDAYGLLAIRPGQNVTVRSEVHALRLADGADFWYGGGGPGQASAFGYAGRPSGGHASLANFWDVSVDAQLARHLGINLYYGRALGGDVIRRIYPEDPNGHFGYVETVVRF